MSEFLAEAQVLIRPDTTAFRAQLLAQLAAIKVPPVVVPVVAAGAGLAGTANAANALSVAQGKAAVTAAQLAGAQVAVAKSANASTAALLGAGDASARLNAGLLGLRTAVGSAAVIGLSAAALGAIFLGKALRAAIINTAAFEQELNTLQAVTGATSQEMTNVALAARRLGADVRLPAVSASDAAVAMTELAKAGLTVEESIEGAEGVLQLATAAQLSNADAALITANALNSFGLAGNQAVRVADDLANAANAAQGSIADFGIAMGQVSAVARQVGLSLEDTTSLLTLLAKNGLRGSDAGTSLRVALLRLVAPTKEAAGLIKTLGINVRDLQGNVRADVFAQFAVATAALGPELRDAAAAAVFGADAIRAVAIAGREGAAGLRVAQFQIDQQGTAALVAAARNKGLGGSFANLENQATNAGLTLGGVLSPALQEIVDVAAFTVKGIDEIASSLTRLADRIDSLPGEGWGRRLFGEFSLIPVKLIDKSAEEVANLRAEMVELQKARVLAEQAGLPTVADNLTAQIQKLRERVRELRVAAGDILPPSTDVEKAARPLQRTLDALKRARDSAVGRGADTSAIDRSIADTQRKLRQATLDTALEVEKAAKTGFAALAGSIQTSLQLLELQPDQTEKIVGQIRNLIAKITALGPQSGQAGRKIALTLVKSIQDAVTAAAISGNTGAAKALKALAERLAKGFEGDLARAFRGIEVPLLGDEIAEALIPSGLDIAQEEALGTRGGVITALQNRREVVLGLIETARAEGAELTDLFNELTSINSRIEGLQNEIASEVEDAQKEKEEGFFARLADALRPIQRLQIRALGTEALGDDIKFREQLIARYRAQIELIEKTLGDTKVARTAIKAIQDLVLAEILKLRTDRQNFQQALRDQAKADQQAVLDKQARIIERAQLNVEFAQTIENVKKEIQARRNLIALYKKAQAAAKGNINEVLRYRNLIAEETAAIKELQGEKKDQGTTFAEIAFDFLQKQQGFAANLLGNLIPSSATSGLVSESQTPTPASGLQAQAAFKTASPTYGQAATEVDILKQVLQVLREIQRGRAHPEAALQRAQVNATMDFQGGV